MRFLQQQGLGPFQQGSNWSCIPSFVPIGKAVAFGLGGVQSRNHQHPKSQENQFLRPSRFQEHVFLANLPN